MVELREETGVQRSLTERLMRSRQENGGVKGRDGSAEELDRETGEEQTGEEWWSYGKRRECRGAEQRDW